MSKKNKIQGSVTVNLQIPVDFGGEIYTCLDIQRPKAKHIRKLDLGNITAGNLIDLLKDLVDVPDKVIDELDLVDFTEISGVLNDFFVGGQKTGDNG